MSVGMYQATLPPAIRALTTLRHLIAVAAAHCEERKIDPAAVIGFRLFPDMLPFASQIRIATDMSKLCVWRLTGAEAPKFPDDEKSFAELDARLATTLAFLGAATPSQIDGTEDEPITFKTARGEVTLKAIDYVQRFVLPNVYFHTTTTYNMLRHNGVGIGKADFLGAL
jgi:uncharacterized protein